MRILITGAGGFVGGALIKALEGHDLVLPARDPAKLKPAGARAEVIPFDPDLAALAEAARPEVVVNLLGIISESQGAGFFRVHEEYTRRLLEGARRAGAVKFVQMSALGAAPDSPSAYQRSKFAGEELVRASGLPWVIFRPSFITGEGQRLAAELRSLARFLPAFAGPSDAYAAPVPVGDVAACFARAACDPGIRNELFELGGPEVVSFRDILALTLAGAGIRRPVLGLPRIFFRPLLPLFSLFPSPPMTREQYLMLGSPNVPSGTYRGVRDLV